MKIETQKNALNVVDLSVVGTVITVGDLTIDCAAEQEDSKKIMDVSADESGVLIIGTGQRYVMNVIIPGKKYAPAVDENPPEPIALTGNDVTIKLWNYTA